MPVDPATFKFETPQFDPRFPNQNQSKHCAQAYVDYHKCVNVKVKNLNHAKSFSKLSLHYALWIGLKNGMIKELLVNSQSTWTLRF